ncbi:MAG: Metallo-hydrolase/oxidoreductase [Aureobasidium pullulans]|nr:MAG: Metallo-hydrolase/oxidoreductase [Aureobasidium pullulans]
MAIIIKGSKSNKHNIIGVCLSGLQSVVEQVQRLAPSGHFAKTINISEYPEDSGEMIFFADTDGIAQINTKELEVVDPKMPEDKIASDFEMGYAASKIFAQTLGATKGKKSLPERVTDYYYRVTRPEPCLPSYSAFRPLDVAY